jgi:hypothetical protein
MGYTIDEGIKMLKRALKFAIVPAIGIAMGGVITCSRSWQY